MVDKGYNKGFMHAHIHNLRTCLVLYPFPVKPDVRYKTNLNSQKDSKAKLLKNLLETAYAKILKGDKSG